VGAWQSLEGVVVVGVFVVVVGWSSQAQVSSRTWGWLEGHSRASLVPSLCSQLIDDDAFR
jgi:hypothetical protein